MPSPLLITKASGELVPYDAEKLRHSLERSGATPELSTQIAEALLHMLLQKIEEKDIHLIPGEELIEHIGSAGFDPQFGVRPVKRLIQKELLNEMSRQIIAGTLEPGVEQVIDVFDGKIVVRKPIAEKEKSNGKAKKSSVA